MVDFPKLSNRLTSVISSDGVQAGIQYCESEAPWLIRQLTSDAKRNGPLSFWGRSRNIDELAGGTIVAPQILELVAAVTKKRLSPKTPHAGLQHTYGYLLSTLETEYGFKRDRWLSPDIADAFGLNAAVLSPSPDSGTLLANVTAFAGRFAWRNEEAKVSRLISRLEKHASADVLQLDIEAVQQMRVTENLQHTWRGQNSKWHFQTDLVDRAGLSVLIYTLKNLTTDQHDLITLFPIQSTAKKEILDRVASRTLDDIRLRYNAYVPGMSGRLFSGSATVSEF